MSRRRVAAMTALIAVAALVVWWRSYQNLGGGSPEPVDTPTEFPAATPLDHDATARDTERPSDAEARRQVAEALREAIRRARDERLADSPTEATGGGTGMEARGRTPSRSARETDPGERPGSIDPQYIREAVQQLRPLLAECYELARDAAERDERPVPEGRLVSRFVFSGEPDVGGVVEESEVLEESTLRDPVLEECFNETLFTLELPAPDEGGTITVHYPFVLSNEPEEE